MECEYDEYGEINLSDKNTYKVIEKYLNDKYCFISGTDIKSIYKCYIEEKHKIESLIFL